jgi:hypothetical protein
MDRKDHIIAVLTQLNDDLRAKLVNLYADAKLAEQEKDEDKKQQNVTTKLKAVDNE